MNNKPVLGSSMEKNSSIVFAADKCFELKLLDFSLRNCFAKCSLLVLLPAFLYGILK